MVGAIANHLHEGSRSEYLAQYIFASFGTAIAVPHQEDSGVDLYCTLTEPIGQRAWQRGYFTVQVKSTMDPWKFESELSVRWLIEHPLPLFLCIVDKSLALIRVYHTSPRFYVWAMLPPTNRLELIPTTDQQGMMTCWDGSTTFSLGAPIIEASVKDLLDDTFHRNVWEVLRFWIDLEQENLKHVTTGIHTFRGPHQYRTNVVEVSGWITYGGGKLENLDKALDQLRRSLDWLSSVLLYRKDIAGAARCAMLLRHLFKEECPDLPFVNDEINRTVIGPDNSMQPRKFADSRSLRTHTYRGIDKLNAELDAHFTAGDVSDHGTEGNQNTEAR